MNKIFHKKYIYNQKDLKKSSNIYLKTYTIKDVFLPLQSLLRQNKVKQLGKFHYISRQKSLRKKLKLFCYFQLVH